MSNHGHKISLTHLISLFLKQVSIKASVELYLKSTRARCNHTLQPLVQGGINSALHHRQEFRVHKEPLLRVVLLPLLVAS